MDMLFPLPSEYKENTLVLMVQNPRVLYAYWGLSVAQRIALTKKGNLQLRLYTIGVGLCRTYNITSYWDSFYFNGVEPGCRYYCDISVYDNGVYLPFISSNFVLTPAEGPIRIDNVSSDFSGKGEIYFSKGISSESYYK